MNLNEQFQSRIELLNNYALCLERENESKSKEISTLHNHLEVCTKENDSLRNIISDLKFKLNQKELENTLCQSLMIREPIEEGIYRFGFFDAECQTDIDDYQKTEALKRQVDSLKQVIKQNETKIENYQSECQEMYEGIQKLEKCLAEHQLQNQKYQETITYYEGKLKTEERRRIAVEQKLQATNMTMSNVDQENKEVREHIYSLQVEVTELITKNNKLIERTRELQKQKNDYFKELKKHSRISFGTDLSNSSFKRGPSKVKDQRWREIQANLKKLQQENQAIESNLALNR